MLASPRPPGQLFSIFGRGGTPQGVKNLTGCGKTMSAREDFEGVAVVHRVLRATERG